MTVPYHRAGSRRLAPPPRKFSGSRWQTAIGVLLIAAGAYSAGTTYAIGEENQDRAECQARVNRQVVSALQVRDDANKRATEAQRALVTARLRDEPPGTTPRAADQAYLRALDQLARVREANPIQGAQTC